ncbi:tail completion protein gp17 [Glacieibacterium megasporae]|uniref:tail completion protein gp17 n=1 Tax=Glacieibacterium megasporae TaxID=2835787 RepID=UPI001C1DE98A|nr:DUF3168 domain-containing protein [Polymorphobacter megasporae]UAJ08810.1 DUF3168 domain-containing protein [Polymorphobacter megasporae]
MSASLAVQSLIVAALRSAPGLEPLTGVCDGVAPDAVAPYLTVGPDSMADWSHQTGTGHEHAVRLALWDDRPGTARVKVLAAAAETAIRALSGSRDATRIAGVAFIRTVFVKDPGGWTQAAIDFRIRTEQL